MPNKLFVAGILLLNFAFFVIKENLIFIIAKIKWNNQSIKIKQHVHKQTYCIS